MPGNKIVFTSLIFLLFFGKFLSADLLAQNPVQVSGIVRDEERKPLPYAHIIIVNRQKGTVTDRNGMFSFIGYPNDTIHVSSMGFKTRDFVIPENIDVIHYPVDVTLEKDTVLIEEVTIFPWKDYEEFKEVFLALDLPMDDYDRAMANIALIKLWIEMDDGSDPAASFRHVMSQHHHRTMYAGQLPPVNILNPVAWARFIKALREGQLKIE